MNYILIDKFNDNINIITNEEGEVLIIDNYIEAKEQASIICQEGIVVPLINFMPIIEDTYDMLSVVKYELGEEVDLTGDSNDSCIETDLGKLLGL